jgi:hypothetical protein
MRNFALPITLLAMLFLFQSTPVATPSFAQPFPPLQRPILNGCSENALFAILNTGEGKYCLENLLPRASNAPSDYSIFCSGAQWGCCLKQAGLTGCKVRGQIPSRRIPRPPATRSP